MIAILTIISALTVFIALFMLKTKTIGEWSLLAVSYGLFLFFILYWESNGRQLDTISTSLFLVSYFFNAAHEVMQSFYLDTVFQLANGNINKVLWKDININGIDNILGPVNVELIRKEAYDDIIRFELRMTHPLTVKWHYLLDFDKDIDVFSGQAKICFKDKEPVILKAGDFMVIRRKEIHTFETVNDTVFKLSCRK